VRSLLQSGQISYNLNSRVLNYSMGLPHVGWFWNRWGLGTDGLLLG
jgi:hypothetical protein